jgi:ribosomal protein S18 acetylase RimI-like enzyme
MPAVPAPIDLPPAQRGSAAEVLALAFQNDPIARYVMPDETHRCRVLRWMFQRHLRYGQRYGVISTTTTVDGVAIWLPPGQTTQTLGRLLRTGALLAPLKFGWGAFQRSMTFMAHLTTWHRQYAPDAHWYLFYLGVAPTQQGRGIGSALLQPVLARADADQLPCYLETGTERNLGFYQRHGFAVVAEGALPRGGPRLWAMRRAPHDA